MKKEASSTSENKKGTRNLEEKVPWSFSLMVKDLVDPITIKRVQILKIGVLVLIVVGIGYALYDNLLRQPTGEEMVTELVDSAGGMEAWDNLKFGEFTRTHNLYSDKGKLLDVTKETFYFKKTDNGVKLQVKSIDNEGKEIWVGKDENGYWASKDHHFADAKATAQEHGMMCDSKFCEPLCASSMAFFRFSMPFKLTDPGVQASLGSTDFSMLNFNPVQHLNMEPLVLDISYAPEVGKDRWKFFVDPNDKLIHKIEYYNKSDMGEIRPEEIYWSDHKTVNGITFSHKWTRYWPNGKIMDEYVYTDVDFSTEIADEFFNRPTDLDYDLASSN